MDADGQAVAFGRFVDRPVLRPAKRQFAADQQQHLHEATVGSPELDLLHRAIGVEHRHDDGGAEARVLVEKFPRGPGVQRPAERDSDGVAVGDLHAVERVQDGRSGAEGLQRLFGEPRGIRGTPPLPVPPIGANGQRRRRRIGNRVEFVETAADCRLPPLVIEIWQQRPQAGHGGMDVTVDRAGHHAGALVLFG